MGIRSSFLRKESKISPSRSWFANSSVIFVSDSSVVVSVVVVVTVVVVIVPVRSDRSTDTFSSPAAIQLDSITLRLRTDHTILEERGGVYRE